MANIAQFQKAIQPLLNPSYLEKILFDEIRRFENIFVNQQKAQLNEGLSYKGKIFGEYSQATEEIAKNENPRKPKIAGQPFNFEYTGSFFDGMELQVFQDRAEFWSTDSKTPMLVAKYDDLFGLTPERFSKIFDRVIFPAFMNEIRKTISL